MGIAEDKLEILELIARYSHAVDEFDAEAFANLFTEDGERGGPGPEIDIGQEALLERARARAERLKSQGITSGHHQNSTIFMELTPERAVTRTKLILIWTEQGKPPYIRGTLVYEDVIVRTPVGWKFKKRTGTLDATPIAPPS